jgi:phosphatidylserine/phosphatidylglycerophosphate/cardiolipin synthase-like enzyme
MAQAPATSRVTSVADGIRLTAYGALGTVLLAFDLDHQKTDGLAGFSVSRRSPNGTTSTLPNRLNFSQRVTSATTPEQRQWTGSDQAPFQKFRWIDFPAEVAQGSYTYQVSAMYFDGDSLRAGPTTAVSLNLAPQPFGRFSLGFTRGYLSSQAYAERFGNRAIAPNPMTLDYDTAPYEAQYDWLGYEARRLLMAYLDEVAAESATELDAFIFDFDEPAVLDRLVGLGSRLRVFMDDSNLHRGAIALEVQARLEASAGKDRVKLGHFNRFAHSKVMIQKRDGQAVKVLTGSANFSVRGLYVQANNVMVIDDPAVAAAYELAFEEAFNNMAGFAVAAIAHKWFDFAETGLPQLGVCFSPHQAASISLEPVAQAISGAHSSVLFAVMELAGGGDVLAQLQQISSAGQHIFSYGVTQTTGGLKLYKPGAAGGSLASFAYLKSKVPAPFRTEWSGGPGQVVHHKFVVVDFNDEHPTVFAGSSNLAQTGEMDNGDNLLQINDSAIATAYGIEAIRLFDHYHFRDAMQSATDVKPLMLQGPGEAPPWWQPYYELGNVKSRDRQLFAGA